MQLQVFSLSVNKRAIACVSWGWPKQRCRRVSVHRSRKSHRIVNIAKSNRYDYDTAKEESFQKRRDVYDFDRWARHRSSSRWSRHLVTTFRSEIIRGILAPVAAEALFAALVCWYERAHDTGQLPSGFPDLAVAVDISGPFGLSTFALALLLVFRTNTSYARFDEARKFWGGVVNRSRDVMRQSVTWLDPVLEEQRLKAMARWMAAFPWAMKCHLRAKEDLRSDLEGILQEGELQYLLSTAHRPNTIIQVLSELIWSSGMEQDKKFRIDENLTAFSDYLGASERLLRTPIPPPYTRHTSRFLILWLACLPFVLWDQVSWAALPACTVIAFVLLAIDEIGVQIEEPFSILPLESISTTITTNVGQLLVDEGRSFNPSSARLYRSKFEGYRPPSPAVTAAQAAAELSRQASVSRAASIQDKSKDGRDTRSGESGGYSEQQRARKAEDSLADRWQQALQESRWREAVGDQRWRNAASDINLRARQDVGNSEAREEEAIQQTADRTVRLQEEEIEAAAQVFAGFKARVDAVKQQLQEAYAVNARTTNTLRSAAVGGLRPASPMVDPSPAPVLTTPATSTAYLDRARDLMTAIGNAPDTPAQQGTSDNESAAPKPKSISDQEAARPSKSCTAAPDATAASGSGRASVADMMQQDVVIQQGAAPHGIPEALFASLSVTEDEKNDMATNGYGSEAVREEKGSQVGGNSEGLNTARQRKSEGGASSTEGDASSSTGEGLQTNNQRTGRRNTDGEVDSQDNGKQLTDKVHDSTDLPSVIGDMTEDGGSSSSNGKAINGRRAGSSAPPEQLQEEGEYIVGSEFFDFSSRFRQQQEEQAAASSTAWDAELDSNSDGAADPWNASVAPWNMPRTSADDDGQPTGDGNKDDKNNRTRSTQNTDDSQVTSDHAGSGDGNAGRGYWGDLVEDDEVSGAVTSGVSRSNGSGAWQSRGQSRKDGGGDVKVDGQSVNLDATLDNLDVLADVSRLRPSQPRDDRTANSTTQQETLSRDYQGKQATDNGSPTTANLSGSSVSASSGSANSRSKARSSAWRQAMTQPDGAAADGGKALQEKDKEPDKNTSQNAAAEGSSNSQGSVRTPKEARNSSNVEVSRHPSGADGTARSKGRWDSMQAGSNTSQGRADVHLGSASGGSDGAVSSASGGSGDMSQPRSDGAGKLSRGAYDLQGSMKAEELREMARVRTSDGPMREYSDSEIEEVMRKLRMNLGRTRDTLTDAQEGGF